MIRAVLFDIGGTLHTSSTTEERKLWFAKRLLDRLGDYGIDLRTTPEELRETLDRTPEEYKHYSEKTKEELPAEQIWADWYLKPFGVTVQQMEPIAEELSFLYDYERTRMMRRPGVKETILKLKEMGIQVGIISNIISRSVVPHFLAEYGILEQMDVILLSSETGCRKPDPGMFHMAEKKLGLKPEEMAFVGDTISRDVIGCRNAGWKLMFQIENPGIAHRDRGLTGPEYEPDYHIKELMEIPEILEGLNEK